VIADVSTRWNSSYYAWVRLIKIKKYIQALLTELLNSQETDARKDGRQLEQFMLSSDEWDLLQQLILILGPFEEATKYLGGEKYVTHSIMHPMINEIKRLLLISNSRSSTPSTSPIPISPTLSSRLPSSPSSLANILSEIENADDVFVLIEEVEIQEITNRQDNNSNNSNNDLNQPLKTKDKLDEVKKNLYSAMCYYWNFLPEDYLISTILDPRVKHMNEEGEEEILRNKYEEYKETYLPTPIESRSSSPTPSEASAITYQPRLFSIFDQNQPRVSDEVREYLAEDKISFNQNPFEWWAGKKTKYPVLSKMARIYLAAPATSTPSERLFSDAGNLLSAKRTRMGSELFKRIMFLKRNASKVDSIYSYN